MGDGVVATADGLTFGYGRRQVFEGLNLHFAPGVTGLLGPNGAGKSTLMSLLATRRAPSAGRLIVLGHDVATGQGRAAIRPKLGMLPQRFPLVGSMTVIDTVAYAAWTQGVSRRESYGAAVAVLGVLDVADLGGRRVRTLSGGQRQRVGLAATLAHEPSLLILDEPTAGLDPQARMELRRTLRLIAERASIIVSTHLADDVAVLCDEVIVLARGEPIYQGGVDRLEAFASDPDDRRLGSPLEQGYAALLAGDRHDA